MPQPASAPFPVGPGADRPRDRRRAGRKEAALRKHRIFARLAEGRSHAAIRAGGKLFAPVDQKNYR